jgi:hypothetical protein
MVLCQRPPDDPARQRPRATDRDVPATPDEADRIRRFFEVFRWRIKALEEIHSAHPNGRMASELAILWSAGIDALANFWGELYAPQFRRDHRQRMGAFLAEHGGSLIFRRVVAPLLLDRARNEARPWRGALSAILAIDLDCGWVREAKEDPLLDALLHDPRVQQAKIPPEWLRAGRYGEVIYTEIRCMWVHESGGSPMLGSPDHHRIFPDMLEPHYSNLTDTDGHRRKELFVPFAFRLATYKHAVASFEGRCLADGKLPRRA